MKNVLFILCMIFIFISCKSNKKYVGYVVEYKTWDYMIIRNDSNFMKISNHRHIYKKYSVNDTIK